MDDNSVTLDSIWSPPMGERGRENRHIKRMPAHMQGRLAYGGTSPGLVGCDVLDMSEAGVRVETFARLDALPDILTLEICGIYNRVRRCWTQGRQIGLAFIPEDTQYLDDM